MDGITLGILLIVVGLELVRIQKRLKKLEDRCTCTEFAVSCIERKK